MMMSGGVSGSTGMLGDSNVIEVYGADSAEFLLTIVDDAGEIVDLTGAFIGFTVKTRISDEHYIFRKTTDQAAEIEITTPRAGEATIKLTGLETECMDCKSYLYDVRVVLASGFRQTVIEPTPFIVKRAVGTY